MRKDSMNITAVLAIVLSFAPQQQQQPPLREVTVTAIPGVIAAGTKWQLAWDGTNNADGITGMPDGSLLFAQEQPNTIRKLDTRDYDSAFVKDTHGAGSVAVDSQGRLIAVQRTCTDPGRGNLPCSETPKISIIYPEKDRKVLTDNYKGKPFARPNDLVVGRNGVVYFTAVGAFYVRPGGQAMAIAEDNIRTNGIILSPDEKTLYVTNGGVVVAFDVQPDGSTANRRDFAKLPSGNGDGLAVDDTGRLYVTAQASGIHVFSPDGKHLGTIPTPRDVISAAFAGPDKKTLYIVGGGALGVNGKEFTLPEGVRNNAKSIYKIQMIAQGFKGRAK
jgi:gluconolactonase